MLRGDDLAALLARVGSADDYAGAAQAVLDALVAGSGAARATLLRVDDDAGRLVADAWVGHDAETPAFDVALAHRDHPIVAATFGGASSAWEAGGVQPLPPYEQGVALPLPGGVAGAGERGRTPASLVLIDVLHSALGDAAAALETAAALLGPVLARRRSEETNRVAADELDHQRDLLAALLNALPDPIVITGADRELLVQNRRAEHLLSASEDASEGRTRAVEINNLLLTSFLHRMATGEGGRRGGARELNLVDPAEGADLLFEVLSRPLPEGTARPGARVSVLRDVTDLRRAAGELERQVQRVRLAEVEASRERDRLNLILANVGDPILVTDASSNIVLMNREAEQLFHGAAPSAAGVPSTKRQAVRGNDTKFLTVIAGFAHGGEATLRHEMRLRHPRSGAEFPVEVVSGKVLDERGETVAVVSVFHDLTKQVENETLYEALKRLYGELEERVRAATADLAEQNRRLQWQATELEKANRLKSDFLASMSHELRTPINALIGYASLMLDRLYGELTPKQEQGLNRIQASAQHLLALINDILDLAKIEAGKMPVNVGEVRLADVAGEIAEQIDPMVRKKLLAFDVDVPADLPVLHTDRTKVKQILLNLLSNAAKFTHEGRVALRAYAEPGGVVISVTDTGIGIAREDREAIWDDFRQIDQSRTREYGGTGLGLSITKKLVRALGGTVTVDSEPGVGSTFTVRLPADAPVLRLPEARAAD